MAPDSSSQISGFAGLLLQQHVCKLDLCLQRASSPRHKKKQTLIFHIHDRVTGFCLCAPPFLLFAMPLYFCTALIGHPNYAGIEGVARTVRAPCEVSIFMSLSWSPLVRMSSTIAQVRVIESQQLCWVLHRSPGTFCGSNVTLVAK